ncbi:group II intron maturase-specific domain-containing protein [Streptomyces sp. NPDC002537]
MYLPPHRTTWLAHPRPSKKAEQASRAWVAARIYRRAQNQSPATLLESVNRALAGWAYFRHGTAKRTFDAVDHHAWHRIAI